MRGAWPIRLGMVLGVLLLGGPSPVRARDEHAHEAGDLGRVGTTHFPVSCSSELQAEFDRAVAILHSFFYEESERRFAAIAPRDLPMARHYAEIARAMRAALASQNPAAAQRYAAELLALVKDGEAERPELATARWVAGGAPPVR